MWGIAIIALIVIIVSVALYIRYKRSQNENERVGVGGAGVYQPESLTGADSFSVPAPNPPSGPVTAQPIPGVPFTVAGDFTDAPSQGNVDFGAAIPKTSVIGSHLDAVAFLVLEQGNRPGRQYPLGEQNIIGRDGGQCNIVIDDSSISRQHARIKQQNPKSFYIYDLAATNTTRVNGQKTSGMRLEDGDKIELGRVRLVFKQVK